MRWTGARPGSGGPRVNASAECSEVSDRRCLLGTERGVRIADPSLLAVPQQCCCETDRERWGLRGDGLIVSAKGGRTARLKVVAAGDWFCSPERTRGGSNGRRKGARAKVESDRNQKRHPPHSRNKHPICTFDAGQKFFFQKPFNRHLAMLASGVCSSRCARRAKDRAAAGEPAAATSPSLGAAVAAEEGVRRREAANQRRI